MDSDEQTGEQLRLMALIQGIPGITPAEVKICLLILAGKSTRQIAAELGVSLRTVENHRYRIRRKMKCSDNLLVGLMKMVGGGAGMNNTQNVRI